MGQLTRQALWVTLEKATHLGAGMGLLVMVARTLGPPGLGAYAYAVAVTAVFVPVLDAGLHLLVIKRVAADAQSDAVGDALGLKLRIGPVAVALAVLAAWGSGKSPDVIAGVLLMGLSVVAMSWGDATNAAFKGLHRAAYGAMLAAGTNAALLGGGIWAVSAGGVLGLAGCYAGCRTAYAATGWAVLRRVAPHPQSVKTRTWDRCIVRQGVRHLPAAYFVALVLNLHFLTIDWMSGGRVSGAYAVGYRTAASLVALGSANLEMVLAALSRDRARRSNVTALLGRSFWRLLGLGGLGAGLVYVGALPVVQVLFGPTFADAVPVVRTLAWTLPPFLLCALGHMALLALDREKAAFRAMALFAIGGAVLGVVGGRLFGPMGTAGATVLTGWVFAGVLGRQVFSALKTA